MYSSCGYSTEARSSKGDSLRRTGKQVQRHAPYNFTGCLAHADITWHASTGIPLHLKGYLLHDSGCHSTIVIQAPTIPLHSDVLGLAVMQLKQGAG